MTDPYDNTGPPVPVPAPDNGILGPWDVIFAQYANSPVITGLINLWFESLDEFPNLQSFFDNVWDIDDVHALNGYGANGWGMDVWGRIVGVNRVLKVQNVTYFGWNAVDSVGFNQGLFFNGSVITSNHTLDDQTFLRLVMAKARANISNGSYQDINKMLLTLFPGRGNAWVSDSSLLLEFFGFRSDSNTTGFNQAPFFGAETAGPAIVYNFAFHLNFLDLAIVNSGVLPKPTGYPATVSYIA